MASDDRCPKCGAERVFGSTDYYTCGSCDARTSTRESENCLRRQLAEAREHADERYRPLVDAADRFRDIVLHQRGPLEEPCLDSDQTNAVLAAFDDEIGSELAALVPPAGEAMTKTNDEALAAALRAGDKP